MKLDELKIGIRNHIHTLYTENADKLTDAVWEEVQRYLTALPADDALRAKLEAEAFNPTYDDRMGKWIPLLRAKEVIRQHQSSYIQSLDTSLEHVQKSCENVQELADKVMQQSDEGEKNNV